MLCYNLKFVTNFLNLIVQNHTMPLLLPMTVCCAQTNMHTNVCLWGNGKI